MTAVMKYVLVVVLAICTGARPVHADDPQDTADTLVSPWRGAAMRLAADEKRFVLAFNTLFEGVRLRGEASAPLDGDTRVAAFAGTKGLAPGFRGALYLGYDSTYRALALGAGDPALLAYCERHQIKPCLQSKADEQMRLDGQPPARSEMYWGAGIGVSYAYDGKTAFVDDVASKTDDFRVTNLQLDASAVLSWPNRLAVSARVGYERADRVSLANFRRCVTLPSTSMSVTGVSCSDAQYLLSDPAPEGSGHARTSFAYYPFDSLLAHYIAATELRVNAENVLTDAASLDVHLIAFFNGVRLGDGVARIGLGATIRTALASPDGADYVAGDIYDYSLFGVVGTSF